MHIGEVWHGFLRIGKHIKIFMKYTVQVEDEGAFVGAMELKCNPNTHPIQVQWTTTDDGQIQGVQTSTEMYKSNGALTYIQDCHFYGDRVGEDTIKFHWKSAVEQQFPDGLRVPWSGIGFLTRRHLVYL